MLRLSQPEQLQMRAFPFLLVLIWLLMAPTSVQAHAEFRGSDPTSNALLQAAPAQIVLMFSEPVSPLVVRFATASGDASEVDARSQDSRVIVPLPPNIGAGTHLLSWRVVSVDGHPIGGSLVFSVGGVTSRGEARNQDGVSAAIAAASRFALTLAIVVGIGGTVFIVVVARDMEHSTGMRFLAWSGNIAVFPLAALSIVSQGLDMMALPIDTISSLPAWRAGLGSPIAATAFIAALAGTAALVALQRSRPLERLRLGLVAWILGAGSFALSGHAAVADPRWLAAPSVALHGFALIFWMGCLLPLFILLCSKEEAGPVIARFSAIAVALVAVLFATGAILTVLQSGSMSALLHSNYGTVLLAKLVAVVCLLLLAARNRLRLTPELEAGHITARQRMARAIRLEILLGLIVIALASSFRLTPPPRSLAATPQMQVLDLTGNEVSGSLAFAPGMKGPNEVRLRLTSSDGVALEPLDVVLKVSLPSQGIEPIAVAADPEPDGTWRTDLLNFPISGEWTVEVDVLITDFRKETLRSTLHVMDGE